MAGRRRGTGTGTFRGGVAATRPPSRRAAEEATREAPDDDDDDDDGGTGTFSPFAAVAYISFSSFPGSSACSTSAAASSQARSTRAGKTRPGPADLPRAAVSASEDPPGAGSLEQPRPPRLVGWMDQTAASAPAFCPPLVIRLDEIKKESMDAAIKVKLFRLIMATVAPWRRREDSGKNPRRFSQAIYGSKACMYHCIPEEVDEIDGAGCCDWEFPAIDRVQFARTWRLLSAARNDCNCILLRIIDGCHIVGNHEVDTQKNKQK